jgi:hypothetical protein
MTGAPETEAVARLLDKADGLDLAAKGSRSRLAQGRRELATSYRELAVAKLRCDIVGRAPTEAELALAVRAGVDRYGLVSR